MRTTPMMLRLKIALLALVTLALGACYKFPPPEVVKQTNPSPLVGATSFVVAPVTFRGFTYNGVPEADWMRSRSEQQRASWENDKVKINEKMMTQFAGRKKGDQSFVFDRPVQKGQFLVAINVDRYDGQMRWTAEIRDAEGQPVDIIRDPMAIKDAFNTWMALNTLAALCPDWVTGYLHSRAFPEPKP